MKIIHRPFFASLLLLAACISARAELLFERNSELVVRFKNQSDVYDFRHLMKSVRGADKCDRMAKGSGGSFVVSGCFPAHIEPMIGASSLLEGPNCFGAALAGAGVQDFYNELSEDELEFVLSSVYCAPISRSKIKAFDILVLRKQAMPIHALTVLSKKYGLTKNGRSAEYPYTVEPITKTVALYSQPDLGECAECTGKQSDPGCAYCFAPVESRYYRCRRPVDASQPLLTVATDLDAIESILKSLSEGKSGAKALDFESLANELLRIKGVLAPLTPAQDPYWVTRLKLQLVRLAETFATLYRFSGGDPAKDRFYLVPHHLQK